MGGKSTTTYIQDPALIEQLKAMNQNYAALQAQFNDFIQKTNAEMEHLRKEAMKEQVAYEKLGSYIAGCNKHIEMTSRVALIGDKGSGKTTFLFLRGEIGMSEDSLENDGTKEITLTTGGTFVDTIGTKMDMNSLLKLFAVLIDVGMPNTFILFSNNKVAQDLLLFAHFMIRDLIVCPLVPHLVYEQDEPLAKINARLYYNQKKLASMKTACIRTITHLDPIMPIDGNIAAIETLFPGRVMVMPSWSEFMSNDTALNVIRHKLCKYYWLYKTRYNSDQRTFLNSFDV